MTDCRGTKTSGFYSLPHPATVINQGVGFSGLSNFITRLRHDSISRAINMCRDQFHILALYNKLDNINMCEIVYPAYIIIVMSL